MVLVKFHIAYAYLLWRRQLQYLFKDRYTDSKKKLFDLDTNHKLILFSHFFKKIKSLIEPVYFILNKDDQHAPGWITCGIQVKDVGYHCDKL